MSRLKPPGRPCVECRQSVPAGARICPSCKSYQDWRRFVAIGQTNLALVLAILSVLTTLTALGVPLFQARGLDVGIVYESMSDELVTLLARNDGRSSAVITINAFRVVVDNITGQGFGDSVYIVWLSHDGQLVEPG